MSNIIFQQYPPERGNHLKVVITGATGLLGRALHHEFEALPDPQAAPPWWVVQPWGFSRADGLYHSPKSIT
jgi:hypothetical protein